MENVKSYIDDKIDKEFTASHLPKVQGFVLEHNKEKEQQRTSDSLRFGGIDTAMQALVSSLSQNFPSNNFGWFIDAAPRVTATIMNPYIYEGVTTLRGECDVGTSFRKQALFLNDFAGDAGKTAMDVYRYFFNYSFEVQTSSRVSTLKKIGYCLQNLVFQDTEKKVTLHAFRNVEVKSPTPRYLNNPQPQLVYNQKLYVMTPIGLTAPVGIEELSMFPEIRDEVVDWWEIKMTECGFGKASMTEGYKKLKAVLRTVTEMYAQFPDCENNNPTLLDLLATENILGFRHESKYCIDTNYRQKIKGSQTGVFLSTQGRKGTLAYFQESDALFYMVDEDESYEVVSEKPFLYETTDDNMAVVEFELRIFGNIDGLVDQIQCWMKEELDRLEGELSMNKS